MRQVLTSSLPPPKIKHNTLVCPLCATPLTEDVYIDSAENRHISYGCSECEYEWVEERVKP
jgi:transposase-like protein